MGAPHTRRTLFVIDLLDVASLPDFVNASPCLIRD